MENTEDNLAPEYLDARTAFLNSYKAAKMGLHDIYDKIAKQVRLGNFSVTINEYLPETRPNAHLVLKTDGFTVDHDRRGNCCTISWY